jgi:hypothetical protein
MPPNDEPPPLSSENRPVPATPNLACAWALEAANIVANASAATPFNMPFMSHPPGFGERGERVE